MNTKHTPGPWIVGVTGLGNPIDVCEITNGHARIAEYVLPRDANLIAAAPDMLIALERIVASLTLAGEPVYAKDAYQLDCARAALAKARWE